MGEYYAIYKCHMCGKEFRIADSPFKANEGDFPEIIGKIIRNQQFIGNSILYRSPMKLPHLCGNGDAGIADLIGFKKIK